MYMVQNLTPYVFKVGFRTLTLLIFYISTNFGVLRNVAKIWFITEYEQGPSPLLYLFSLGCSKVCISLQQVP